jgi:hypothetical protein
MVQEALGALKIGCTLRSCPSVCALVKRFERKEIERAGRSDDRVAGRIGVVFYDRSRVLGHGDIDLFRNILSEHQQGVV